MATYTYLLISNDETPLSNPSQPGVTPRHLLGEGFSLLEMMTVTN
jgi:hypothetical protein